MNNKKTSFDKFKFNKYMAMYPFNDTQAFNQWLEINNLTYDKFLQWFNKENQQTISIENCTWMDYLINSYEPAIDINHKYQNPFSVFVDFIIEKAGFILKRELSTISNNNKENINPYTFNKLLKVELIQSLTSMVTQTLTLELNVARVSNLLNGDTSNKRFESYISLLTNKKYIVKTFNEYPLLFEQLILKTNNVLAEYTEFYSRLVNDYKELVEKFGSLGCFINHTSDKGDNHNNGRVVRVCQFENKNIVYKPRKLQADLLFQNLLYDLNNATNTNFKLCVYVNKGNYGWSEFVAYESCENIQDYQSYNQELGQYIALLYILNSSDFHFENVIVNGKHPILIDLESILHINLYNTSLSDLDPIHTVLDSFILPQRVYLPNQKNSIDFSVIGFDASQNITNLKCHEKNIDRDDMCLENINSQITNKQNTPKFNQFNLNTNDMSQLICDGFEELYKFFQFNLSWLGENKNFQLLKNMNFRCLIRPTNFYAAIIQNTFHPDNLRNRNDRNLFISNKIWSSINSDRQIRLITYEYNCLLSGDIPIFNFMPKSNNIVCGNNTIIDKYFEYKVEDQINNIQRNLSNQNLISQLWIIKASMFPKIVPSSITNIQPPKILNSKESLIDLYTQYLINTSTSSPGGYKWMNWETTKNNEWSINFNRYFELYNGNLGSLLYLNYYAHVYTDQSIQTSVKNSLNELILNLKDNQFTNIGGYSGAGGVIYALSKIYSLNPCSIIENYVYSLNKQIVNSIKDDILFDVMSGSAGCILALITAYKVFNDKIFLNTCKQCAEHLIHKFSITDDGCGWDNGHSESRLLGGMSHGVTGISYALAKLGSITKEYSYQNVIKKSIDYEDSLYDLSTNNFIDLRDQRACHENHSDYTGWCNGALGIGLVRLDMLKNNMLKDREKQFSQEIPVFVNKIIKTGFNNNDSLCHGNAGSLEYLYQVSQFYPQFFSENDFNEIRSKIENKVLTQGYKNGTYFNLFDSGLMLGSIGLAYQYLRFSNPKKIGNIMLLA